MEWLEPEMAEFHQKTKEWYWAEYKAMIEKQYGEPPTESDAVMEYAREFSEYELPGIDGNLQNQDGVDRAVEELLATTSPDVFYRCQPYTNQPFMLVTNNPGFPDLYSYLRNGEGMMYNATPAQGENKVSTKHDVAQMARISAHYIVSWISDKNITNLFKKLVEYLDPEFLSDGSIQDTTVAQANSETFDIDEYLQLRAAKYWRHYVSHALSRETGWDDLSPAAEVNPQQGFLGDFYYTTAYKLSTKDSGAIPSNVNSGAILKKEIEMVEPSVLFIAGSHAWETIREFDNPSLIDPEDRNKSISDVKRNVYEIETGPVDYTVALKHPSIGGKYEDEALDPDEEHQPGLIQLLHGASQ